MAHYYIYHHNDTDGRASAAMANLALPTAEKTFIETSYPININPCEFNYKPDDSIVMFLDLSFKPQDIPMLKELEANCKIIWIDHHKASIDTLETRKDFPKSIECMVDDSSCGAILTFKYFHPEYENNLPKFLGLIDHHDRHVEDDFLEMSDCFDIAISSIPGISPTHDVWRELLTGDQIVANLYIERGKIIYDYLQEYNRKFIKKSGVVTKVRGIDAIMVNCAGTSILFDSVKDKFPLCVAWYFVGGHYKYTIYSDGKTVDCNAIASTFGGGGHPGAAGFQSDQLLFLTDNCEKYIPKE